MNDYVKDLEKIKKTIDNLYDEMSTRAGESVIEELYHQVVSYLNATTGSN